jgi:hypothetical protein
MATANEDERDFELEFYKLLEDHPEIHGFWKEEPAEAPSESWTLNMHDGLQTKITPSGNVGLYVPLAPQSVRLLYEAHQHIVDHGCPDGADVVATFMSAVAQTIGMRLYESADVYAQGDSMDAYLRRRHPELFEDGDDGD